MNSRQDQKEVFNELTERIDFIHGLLGLLGSAGANALLAVFIPSDKMRFVAIGGGVIASIVAFPLAIIGWKGKGKQKRRNHAIVFFCCFAFACFLACLCLWLLDAENAKNYPWASSVREFLLTADSVGANLVMFFIALFGSFCLVVAIMIVSSTLNRSRPSH